MRQKSNTVDLIVRHVAIESILGKEIVANEKSRIQN